MSPISVHNVITNINTLTILQTPKEPQYKRLIIQFHFLVPSILSVIQICALPLCKFPGPSVGETFVIINLFTFAFLSSFAYTTYGLIQNSNITAILKTFDYINSSPNMTGIMKPVLIKYRKFIKKSICVILIFVLILMIYDVILLLPYNTKALFGISYIVYYSTWVQYYFFCWWSLLMLLLFCILILIASEQIIAFQVLLFRNFSLEQLPNLLIRNNWCVISLMEMFSFVTFVNLFFIFMNLLLGFFAYFGPIEVDLYINWCITYGIVLAFVAFVCDCIEVSVSMDP